MQSVKSFLKTVAIVGVLFVVVWLGVCLLLEVLFGVAETATYKHVFRLLTSEGGINAWLARAVTVLFVVGVSYGLRLVVSLKKQRRTQGWLVLVCTFVVFNLLMYACTRSMRPIEEGKLITPVGSSSVYHYVTPEGEWKLFEHPGYTPDGENYGPMGEPLKVMTPEAAREYDAWKRRKADESEEQAQTDAERQFRETYLNGHMLASGGRAGEVLLAVKVKPFQGRSPVADPEQAMGQYVLYRLLLSHVDPEREIYLAATDIVFDEIFSEPIGEL